MDLADYEFELPPERIAQHPARPRDAARLLEVTHDALHDRAVRDLPELLRAGDLLVVNDTRVVPAQLAARRGNARIGVTLDRPLPDGAWYALARNARRLRPGDTLHFDGDTGLAAGVVARDLDGGVVLRFNRDGTDLDVALHAAAVLALPPYLDRPSGPLPADAHDYQTIFAHNPGAVAAPTAGLHFSPALLDALEQRGIRRVALTLHVGVGTFLPVRGGSIDQHRLHPERGTIDSATADAITEARRAGGRVVAVGTTTLRLLESAATADGTVRRFAGQTELFIRPGHVFRTADLLLTNFHLPRSTLFMLVCAFAGTGRMRAAYAHAIAASYRFDSYGDACLLHRA